MKKEQRPIRCGTWSAKARGRRSTCLGRRAGSFPKRTTATARFTWKHTFQGADGELLHVHWPGGQFPQCAGAGQTRPDCRGPGQDPSRVRRRASSPLRTTHCPNGQRQRMARARASSRSISAAPGESLTSCSKKKSPRASTFSSTPSTCRRTERGRPLPKGNPSGGNASNGSNRRSSPESVRLRVTRANAIPSIRAMLVYGGPDESSVSPTGVK